MMLRRFAENLREQNWTAIIIEFLLLVIGVFLGIQVANWNEARVDRERERVFLGQLRDEIAENARSIRHQLDYQQQVVDSGRRVLAFLASDGRCSEGCAGLIIDVFHASQIWATPFVRVRYEENQRLGFPTDPATRAAIDAFYAFIDGWDVVSSPPAYRERVRGHLTPDASDALWRGCWRSTGAGFEILVRDCESRIEALDVQAMLVAMHADPELMNGLNFWLGQNLFSLSAMPEALQHADAAFSAIDADLGRP